MEEFSKTDMAVAYLEKTIIFHTSQFTGKYPFKTITELIHKEEYILFLTQVCYASVYGELPFEEEFFIDCRNDGTRIQFVYIKENRYEEKKVPLFIESELKEMINYVLDTYWNFREIVLRSIIMRDFHFIMLEAILNSYCGDPRAFISNEEIKKDLEKNSDFVKSCQEGIEKWREQKNTQARKLIR